MTVRASSVPGAVHLWGRTRADGRYHEIRAGAFDSDGAVSWAVQPTTVTALYVQHDDPGATANNGRSGVLVVDVLKTVSLRARRTGPHAYMFTGVVSPSIDTAHVVLFRESGASRVVTGSAETDGSGRFAIAHTFTGRGTFRFAVDARATANSLAGRSSPLTLRVD